VRQGGRELAHERSEDSADLRANLSADLCEDRAYPSAVPACPLLPPAWTARVTSRLMCAFTPLAGAMRKGLAPVPVSVSTAPTGGGDLRDPRGAGAHR
jgi:hypothetical protein